MTINGIMWHVYLNCPSIERLFPHRYKHMENNWMFLYVSKLQIINSLQNIVLNQLRDKNNFL